MMNLTNQLSIHNLDLSKGICLSIGVFDGLHLGHQHLFKRLIEVAQGKGYSSGIITFKTHPQSVLFPHKSVLQLTTLEKRTKLLKELGIDYVFPINFDLALSRMSAQGFLQVIQKNMNLKILVVGSNFALGRGRHGTVDVLKQLGGDLGFELDIVDPKTIGGLNVSSTTIRKMLVEGNVEDANLLLGRYYSIEGEVVQGDGIGNKLGFPTANILTPQEFVIPSDGIYASLSRFDGKTFGSVTSVGNRPTFAILESERLVETYIMGLDKQLYGKIVETFFIEYIRKQKLFSSTNDLIARMKIDSEIASEIIGKNCDLAYMGTGVATQ